MTKTMQPELRAAHAATIANLIEVTEDPIDAMRLASDLFAMSAYRAERAVAAEAGLASPRAPKPLSKYLRLFTAGLTAKLSAIGGRFSVDEIERLKKLGPAIARRLEYNDSDLAEEIYRLVCMDPAGAVEWIREHLDQIEARFAS
jgi:hypothetical protein